MTYEPHDHGGPVVVEEGGGYGAGVVVGAILVLVILALVGLYMVGGLRFGTGTGGNGNSNNGGGGQPLPTIGQPKSS